MPVKELFVVVLAEMANEIKYLLVNEGFLGVGSWDLSLSLRALRLG